MKKLLLICPLVLLLLCGLTCGAGYLLLRNGDSFLSDAFMKQVSLGVRESPDRIYAYYDEIGYVDGLKGEEPKSGTLVFEGGIEIEHTFTQEEINSWIAAWENDWADLPFMNSEIRINPDGTVEATSSISVAAAESFARTLGYSDAEIAKAKEYLSVIPDPLPLYAKGTASIEQNSSSFDVQEFKVGSVTVPSSITALVGPLLENVVDRARLLSNDTSINYARVTSEGVSFSGTVPASVRVQ